MSLKGPYDAISDLENRWKMTHLRVGSEAFENADWCFHTSLFIFLCYATGNVFRPTKSHAGQTTTQQESIDRSDQPNTKNLCLSAAVWKPLPASTERKNGN